ncbi:pilus assembly protein PapC [Pantoea dispersa]|nr:pilus assembly protein PapC [Pantoea dispersa]
MTTKNPLLKAARPSAAVKTLLLCSGFLLPAVAGAEAERDVATHAQFDPAFLNSFGGQHYDLSRFADGASATPGRYPATVYLNDSFIASEDVELQQQGKRVAPCLSPGLLALVTFRESQLSAAMRQALAQPAACTDLAAIMPDARVSFNSSEQRLDISVPQRYLDNHAFGEVSPSRWDRGINGGLLGYSLNAWQNTTRYGNENSLYAQVNAGYNVAGWYFRHNGVFNQGSTTGARYSALNSYMQRDITPLRARLLAGESATSGVLFDTLPFTGVELATDERMLPASQRGYAPDIRGIARTSARVTVRQAGQVIYETTVSPGEFLINDLYPTGYGGDLEVTVTEADGSVQRFSVPYASVAQLLRPGTSRYSLTAGRLRSDFVAGRPALYQGTIQHGLTNALTAYSGMQLSQNYYALLFGGAISTPIGAVAADVTQARAHLSNRGDSMSGQSYRLSWNKTITDTGSNISLATYRFSTSGFMDFMTAIQSREAVLQGSNARGFSRIKNRATLTASQTLPPAWGQFYVSGSVQNYWNNHGSDVQYQLGYSNRYRSVTWGISAGRSRNRQGMQQDTWLFSLSFPLGSDDNAHQPYVRLDWNRDSQGGNSQQASVSGNLGDDNQFGYSVTGSHDVRNGDSGSLNGQYRAPWSSLNASAAQGNGYRSLSAGASGTLLVHSGGITPSPYSGETFALVEAKGAHGANVSGYPGVEIDSAGYAAVPYLNPYQLNDIAIDTKNAPEDLELNNTQQRVAPWAGAVVKVNFNAQRGLPLLINGSFAGKPLPFGAEVVDESGASVGSTGQGGQLYARVHQPQGVLTVRWGSNSNERCQLPYRLPDVREGEKVTLTELTLTCSAAAASPGRG